MKRPFDVQRFLQEVVNQHQVCYAKTTKTPNGWHIENINELLGTENFSPKGFDALCNMVGDNIKCESEIHVSPPVVFVTIVGQNKKIKVSFNRKEMKASDVIVADDEKIVHYKGLIGKIDETTIIYNISDDDLVDIANACGNDNLEISINYYNKKQA